MTKKNKPPSEKQWPVFSDNFPPDLADRMVPMRSDVWQRTQAGLWMMATTGWSTVGELVAEIAKKFELAEDSRSLRELFYTYLPEAGLAVQEVLPFFQSGLAVVRLSRFAEEICRSYGWNIRESEWARLIRLHDGENQKRHTAMVLAYTREARARGFRAVVYPGVSEKVGEAQIQPDVYVVNRKHSRFYVEVEGRFHRENPEKWHGMLRLQNVVAVVTLTEKRRRSLVDNEIKPLGLSGFAADLESLRQRSLSGSPGSLWDEKW